MVQLFCFVLELRKYHKITQFQNGQLTAILIVCSQMLIRSLADIPVHISQIKKRSTANFFLVVYEGYVKYEEAEVLSYM